MKLEEYHCPNCTATLTVNERNHEAVCEYCGSRFDISDEHYDAEQEGYDFEMGRMRARDEMQGENTVYYPSGYSAPKKRRTWLWVLGWIFCFPIPLTVIIVRSKLPLIAKVILIVLLWGFVLFYGSMDSESTGTAAQILFSLV